MDAKERTSISKFLSLVLRHRPEAIGIELDPQGWVPVKELLSSWRSHGGAPSLDALREVVATNPKQRFSFSPDGLRIRANQGHSIEIDLGYERKTPPEILFHGTVAASLEAIRLGGLQRMARHHVHLSPDRATASQVGQRRGKPVILVVRAGEMAREGHEFFQSTNGVWLTDRVPAEFLEFPDG